VAHGGAQFGSPAAAWPTRGNGGRGPWWCPRSRLFRLGGGGSVGLKMKREVWGVRGGGPRPPYLTGKASTARGGGTALFGGSTRSEEAMRSSSRCSLSSMGPH
jgi:hypothetical protein